MTNRRAQLEKLISKFKTDVNGVIYGMVTDAFGFSAVRLPPKRGGALLQQELEASLAASAQAKTERAPRAQRAKKSAKAIHAEKLAYQKAWRLKKRLSDGKSITKAQEKWLKRYDERRK